MYNVYPPEQLETSQLRLVRHSQEFADSFFDLFIAENDRLQKAFGPFDKIDTLEKTQRYLRESREAWHIRKSFLYAVFDKSTETCIGSAGLRNINWETRLGERSIWLKSSFEGRGLATEACAALNKVGFDLNLEKIQIFCATNNVRAIRKEIKSGSQLKDIVFDPNYSREFLIFEIEKSK